MSENRKKLSKNNFVELLRFVLCLVIFVHHSGMLRPSDVQLFPLGALCADIFFVLTGYFTILHVIRQPQDGEAHRKPFLYAIKYTYNKLARVFPYSLSGTMIAYAIEILMRRLSGQGIGPVSRLLSDFYNLFLEIFYLGLTGLVKLDQSLSNLRNAPMWYLSALMFALPAVVWLGLRFSRKIAVPLFIGIPLVIWYILISNFSSITPWGSFIWGINVGILRGLADIMIGGTLCFAVDWFKRMQDEKETGIQPNIILTVLEFALYSLLFYDTVVVHFGYRQILPFYLFAAGLFFTFSGLSYTSLFQSRLAVHLGSISMPIYCVHWGIYKWVANLKPIFEDRYHITVNYRAAILLSFVLSFICAEILLYLINYLTARKKRKTS